MWAYTLYSDASSPANQPEKRVTFDPLTSEQSSIFAKPHERAIHKLHFRIKSIYVSVAEKKLQSASGSAKNPVFRGL